MELIGQNLIAGIRSAAGGTTFRGIDPATAQELEPSFTEATAEEIAGAFDAAEGAFESYRRTSPEQRASFLRAIAARIEELGDALIERAGAETGLPAGRLTGERGRTVNQLRLFATVLDEGSWVEARIDTPDRSRTPAPKPDVRRMLIPIGPVAVFGASNFPLAFSVAGGDTASALAAGCPVVFKAHPAHPGTSEMVGRAIERAAEQNQIDPGVFSLLHGWGHDVGRRIVEDPRARAVGFTGSLRGGRALFDAAAARPHPIPVYAEMGSVNPVFLLPSALERDPDALAEGLRGSLTLGVGQFCTNPGLVIGLEGEPLERFTTKLAEGIGACPVGTMLYRGIRDGYEAGLARLRETPGVEVVSVAAAVPRTERTEAAAAVFRTSADTFIATPEIREEVFGPSTVLVVAGDAEELEAVAREMEGQLTATIQGSEEDLVSHAGLVEILKEKAGRLIFNGLPTGVEVGHAMHHGGPYPATTDPRSTSVGTAAISRFARPVAFQDFPQEALPPELRDGNPRRIWRLVDGELTREAIR